MRSDMRWLLLLTAIIGIVGCADALKATSLIFGRVPNSNKTTAATIPTTTITTSTTVATIDGDQEIGDDEKNDGEATDEESTKPPLTGIPQIDYIWDPNLPRELNGFNLSTYPFLNSVPDNDDIDFKCDGLHDGFYASIKYSCQLYHHCVYGIRHDFLCANFTAFDQKSFICHFVSEVNCKASTKYWFRNDALYKATTTTSTTTTTIAPPPTTSQASERPRRPEGRRPLRRRRPQHEYYYDDEDYDDDYVEERMNRRRKTNRNRNRRPSEYDDDYDSPPRTNYKDDEDDYSYEQRSTHRHRNRNRDSDDDFEYDRRSYRNRKRPTENKRQHDDDRRNEDTDERRPHSDSRKHQHDITTESGLKRKFNDHRTSANDDRKAHNDDISSYDDRRSLGEDDRPHSDDRRTMHDERRKLNDDRRPADDDRRSSMDEGRRNTHDKRRPTSERRPQYEDDYEDLPKKQGNHDDEDYDDRSYKRPHGNKPEIVPKVRSSSATSSIFNRPRAPPKISRPVPNNEKKKYEYVPQKSEKSTTAAAAPATDEELYDEYDYEGEKMAHIDIKHEPADSKKGQPAPSSQRDQRPGPLRVELKQEKLSSTFNTDELEDEDFDIKDKVTSIKPQRSTSPKVEPAQQPQQQQQQQQQHPHRPAKPDYFEKPKETPLKSNERPALDFNKDEYIPDSDPGDYPDEEIDDRLTKEEEIRQPESVPTRTEFRPNPVPIQEHQMKVPEPIAIPKPIKEEILPKIPYAPPQPQQDLQFKTKFHRLSPSSIRTAAESFQKPNTEPEERDVYTILAKDTISSIREPSGFRPVSYNEQPHDLDADTNPKNRPFVRIMKRPFLPSRGGSPYLPRGLKPVGAGITTSEYTTENSHGSSKSSSSSSAAAAAIGNLQLYGHQLPISRTSPNNAYAQPQSQFSMQMHAPSILSEMRTTTQQPQIEPPHSPLDEIFNGDYDVTLNDALNPTLKPLSQSHESPIGFSLNKYDRANPYARSDVSHAPSQYRSTAIPIPIHSRQAPQTPIQQQQQQQHQHQQPQQQQQQQQQQQRQQPQQSQQSQYYDDEEYDY